MKNAFKYLTSLFIILSSFSLFAIEGTRPQYLKPFNKQPIEIKIETGTPVYEGSTSRQVAILEKDYPKVAANFSIDFPKATNQLWIKAGRSLYVYFIQDDAKVTAIYTAKGQINYTVSTISETGVPETLLLKIKNDYPHFTFIGAKKAMSGGYASYELLFENCHEYLQICSTDDNEIGRTNRILKSVGEAKCRHKLP